MSPEEPEGIPGQSKARRRRRTLRLRTLLIWLAVLPTAAMGAQVAVTAERLLSQSEHLRGDVAASQRIGAPLYTLMVDMQAERTLTAGLWAGAANAEEELRNRREATDKAAAEFRRLAAGSEAFGDVNRRLDGLAAYRQRADARTGGADSTLAYYTGMIGAVIQTYQQEFSHAEDGSLVQDSRPVVSMLSASEMVAREDTILAMAGPSRQLSAAAFEQFISAVGAQRELHETWIAPNLSGSDLRFYEKIIASPDWQAKLRIESAIIDKHADLDSGGVKLPAEVAGWRSAHANFSVQMTTLNIDRARQVLTRGELKAAELETEVAWLIGGSGGGLLLVVVLVVLTTRSLLRRLHNLHERTVTVAEETLPDVVARLQRGQSVDDGVLPAVRGDRDEVGRISDAFARAVAVSVDGHRQLAAERHGFGLFATGIASRTGNLVSRQLSLTEDLQDAFGHDEALLAQLMRADQLTVGMRRQIENLLILAGGEVPDPHTEPMRIADLLREAAAEVEDFRRIERQALDETSVEPQAISQISHLLAELLDNATRFSPPRSKVVIRAETVADGLSVEIEDRGPRVSPERYEEMNRRLHEAPPYSVLAQNAHRLGLFVVGHLADQLRATVTLRRSVYGGTSAVVILPRELLVATAAPEAAPRETEPAFLPAVTAPEPVAALPAPRPSAEREREREPEPVTHTAAGLPSRIAKLPARVPASAPAPTPTPTATPEPEVRQALAAAPTRPALPERVPQTHIAEQLRAPRAPETAVRPDTATPEEVADAWADYERGTQTVEEELRRDRP